LEDLSSYDGPVPRHVAIIMDGNGRWATRHGKARPDGHAAGARSVREVVRTCAKLGVKHLTLYSFSTENWRRPATEVDALMALLAEYLVEEAAELKENRIRLRAIGELEQLPDLVRALLAEAERRTRDHERMELILALSYGSRSEIVSAVRRIAEEARDGRLDSASISEQTVSEHLYTSGVPDPDLIIRTSGELRLSNFLLWQVAYAEMVVTDVLWPDFRTEHLLAAFGDYGRRQRRFGRTGAQVDAPSDPVDGET
jgi:undecaprenyl diphosphate synthase